MLDITFLMRDVRRVSDIVSGIDLIYSGQFTGSEMQKMIIYANLQCIQVQIAPDGNARYCISNVRCEMSFWHVFRHWFNVCRSNFILNANLLKHIVMTLSLVHFSTLAYGLHTLPLCTSDPLMLNFNLLQSGGLVMVWLATF